MENIRSKRNSTQYSPDSRTGKQDYDVFINSAEKQKNFREMKKYAVLYDTLMQKAKEGIKILRDSMTILEPNKEELTLSLLTKEKLLASSNLHARRILHNPKSYEKVYNFLIEALFRTNIKDINSGLKLYRRKVFEGVTLISKSPFIDVEIFIRAIRKELTIKQYPIKFKHREKGRSYISRPAVIARTFFDMVRFRFRRRKGREIRGSGGTGRRAALRTLWVKALGSSNLPFRTTFFIAIGMIQVYH